MARGAMNPEEHNPAQQEVLSLLGAPRGSRPTFDRGLRHELRGRLEDGMEPLVERVRSGSFDGDTLYLSKFVLSQVLGCGRKFMAERGGRFEWSPPTARGTVVHKAIELSVHWRAGPAPLEMVDEAMARLENADKSIGDYLRTCPEIERTELRASAGTVLTQFLECFPPLKPQWRPTTDSPLRAELHGGVIVLSGRPDLALGQPEGTVAGKVMIDFKTGGFSLSHREDLRFYALLEALRILPPRMVATYYLDQGRFHPEAVTEDLLHSAAERAIDAAHLLVEVVSGQRPPDVSPGPACRWCPVQPDCEEGTAHLNSESDRDPYDV